jgi:heptosyltransferase II
MRICLVLPNWVGDAVMTTPALRALRKHYGPAATLIGLARPVIGDVLDGAGWLDGLWPYDVYGADPGEAFRGAVRRLRARRFDVAVLFTNSFRAALLAWLGGARRRVGYARNGRSLLLTHRLQPLKRRGAFVPYPAVDYYLGLAYALGCPEETPALELAVTPADERAADAAWEAVGLRRDRPLVALNSSGAYGEAKLWPDESFGALARRIVEQLPYDVLVLCGPAERERARRIAAAAAPARVRTLADVPPSIGLSKACVRRCRLLVSTDSGPRHFAAAFGVPAVSLFGPTHPAWSDTHYAGEERLQRTVDCGPCQRRSCPNGTHRCMRELSVDEVFAAVCRRLEKSG